MGVALVEMSISGARYERNLNFVEGVNFAHKFPPQLFVGIVKRRPWDAAGGGTELKHMAHDNVGGLGSSE